MLGAVLAGCGCCETPLSSLSVTSPLGSRPAHSALPAHATGEQVGAISGLSQAPQHSKAANKG